MNHEEKRTYIAIDLKSFYASVECSERGLDPLTANLVVADASKTEKTICLAVSPALKSYGIPGRARLFEVVQKVKEVNAARLYRLQKTDKTAFERTSYFSTELNAHPEYQVDFIAAPPRMGLYMQYSTRIFGIYMKYVAPEDIHVYSVDEVFMDVTHYLNTYKMTAHELALKMIREVLATTGITATAGIAENMYLCKVAMDIVAKHMPADSDGVRIAELDEMSYRRLLWDHRPLTDFWRVGRGYAKKLEENGLMTMGDVARCSIGGPKDHYNEELLYRLFGINAELLIDHAWGWEPCTIDQIKAYKPQSNSISTGQVLTCPYTYEKGKLVVREMTDLLVLDLVDKQLKTDQMVLTVGYDIDNMNGNRADIYQGETKKDMYGRVLPKSAHGSINLDGYTSSTKKIMEAVTKLYEQIVNPELLVRRMYVVANHVIPEDLASQKKQEAESFEQLDLFTDYDARDRQREQEAIQEQKERQIQEAMISIKKRFGKNAILKGMNLEEGATTIVRNQSIGGHHE